MCYNFSGVNHMEKPFALLEQTKTLLLQEKLSSMVPYGEALEDSERCWVKFCTAHPGPVLGDVLDLLDQRDRMWSIQRDAAFCLGLQLGMELGRLGEFWDEES